jgi:hypothetical protein
MVKPIDPSKPTGGDGNEKYNPNPKRGPGFFDEILEKAKADRKPSGGGGGIPKVGPKRPLDMKKGGKVRKFNDGGMSLEEKYPGAKITRVPYQEPPKRSETKEFQEAARWAKKAPLASAGHSVTEPKFTDSGDTTDLKKMGRGRVSSGGGGSAGIPKLNRDLSRNMKKGGMVSSASKRADGCAVKGKTRGKMV